MQDLNHTLELKQGAILIADAHENENRKGFWDFLQELKGGKIQTPQLILMGDIFDLLVSEVSATHEFAKPYIALLEELCENMEILYLEGNHDFNLSPFFNKVKVFALEKQPLKLVLHTNEVTIEEIYLAHGDIFLSPFLTFTLKILRNHTLLCLLNTLNLISLKAISRIILKKQEKKNLFYKIENFENLVRQRYQKFNKKGVWFIEGHYHQNFILREKEIKYFNLASFAYKRSFFIVEYSGEIKFREQKSRGQNVW